MLLIWMVGCNRGPDCVLGPNGVCVPEAPDDADGDGYSVAEGDCDDGNPEIHGFDVDGDGYSGCTGDCDEANILRGPPGMVEESCDNVDNDCDLAVDVDAAGVSACLVSDPVVSTRWTGLDLVFVGDADPAFTFTAIQVSVFLPELFRALEGTDTRIGYLEGRRASSEQGVGDSYGDVEVVNPDAPLTLVDGRRWVSMANASADDAATFVRRARELSVVGRYEKNYPLEALLYALGEDDNASFFRDEPGVRAAAFIHTSEDNAGMTGDQFQSEWSGLATVFGPEPTLGCGGVEAPKLAEAVTLDYYPNCGERVVSDLIEAGLALAPATEIAMDYSDRTFDILPATRRATLVLTDGTRVELGPVELEYDATARRVSVRDYVWSDITSVTFEILQLPVIPQLP
jgi:hypothetical protein